MRREKLISRSDFLKADAEGSDIVMERRTRTPIEKWDDFNGRNLPQERDPNTIGNVRRGLEDQLEQNDNMLNGIIDNLPIDNAMADIKDDNANGVPDEQEELGRVASHEESTLFHVGVAAKEEKASLLKELRDCTHEPSDRCQRALHPELVL